MCKKGTGMLHRRWEGGELSDRYAVAFERMEMEAKGGRTVLMGEIEGVPHLYGILDRIHALGLRLLSVQDQSEESR